MKRKIILLIMVIVNSVIAQVKFDANFESGNLKSVSTSDSVTYYVSTNEDIQGRWFYFRITGVEDKFVKVTIMTSPADFTQAMYSYNDIEYFRFNESESPTMGTFQKTFEEDTVYVSYYTPYTYKMLQEKFVKWEKNPFASLDTLGYTQNLLPMQELIITDPSYPDSDKKAVWIHGRTHPGETPSSWHFEGIIEELLSGDEVINYYLSKIKFHLVPFVNPDGVYFGRSRTNYDGVDVEREWNKAESSTCLEARILKARMKELSDEKPFSVFLNLHSQASSYCTFWIHSGVSTSSSFYTKQHQFANLNISDNLYFDRTDLRESNLQSYFPEGWLWNNYGEQVMALTYETPYNNYFRYANEDYYDVSNDNLFEIGQRTVYSISEYLELSHPKRYIIDNENSEVTGNFTNYSTGLDYYGDDFTVLETGAGNSAVIFTTESLPAGKYDIASWWPVSDGNSYETVFEITAGSNLYEIAKTQKTNGGQWNYLTNIELHEEGSISIKMKSNLTGLVVADAFRLLYTGTVTSIEDNNIPKSFVLHQNFPNPFNPSTTIRYMIPNFQVSQTNNRVVNLSIFDLQGQLVSTLVNEEKAPGEYEVNFDVLSSGKRLASGTYFYRLQVGDMVETKKMILMK